MSFLFQLFNGYQNRGAAHGRRTTAESSDAVLHNRSVAVDYGYIIDVHAQFVRRNLRKRRFLTLAVRRSAGEDRDFPGGLDADGCALPSTCGHSLRRAERA